MSHPSGPASPGKSSSSARIRTVEGLRGLAALLVVFDHTVGQDWGLGRWTQQNHGITVFALLTGFLLSGQFLRARLDGRPLPSTVGFLRARGARIFPGYWVALAAAAAMIGLYEMGPGDGWRVLTLTQTFGSDTSFEGLPQAWSLSVFLCFYISLPVWAWWRSRSDQPGRTAQSTLRREVGWLAGLVVLAWAVRATSVTDPVAEDPAFTLLGRVDWFAFGMILAVLAIAQARRIAPQGLLAPGRRPMLALLGAFVLSLIGALIPVELEELRGQLDTAAAVLLVAAAIFHGPVLRGPQRLLASRPARAIGRWSYGIFLWGYILEKGIIELAPTISPAPHLALTLAGAIACGAASWRWVEQPAAKWIGKRRTASGRHRPLNAKRAGPLARPGPRSSSEPRLS